MWSGVVRMLSVAGVLSAGCWNSDCLYTVMLFVVVRPGSALVMLSVEYHNGECLHHVLCVGCQDGDGLYTVMLSGVVRTVVVFAHHVVWGCQNSGCLHSHVVWGCQNSGCLHIMLSGVVGIVIVFAQPCCQWLSEQ